VEGNMKNNNPKIVGVAIQIFLLIVGIFTVIGAFTSVGAIIPISLAEHDVCPRTVSTIHPRVFDNPGVYGIYPDAPGCTDYPNGTKVELIGGDGDYCLDGTSYLMGGVEQCIQENVYATIHPLYKDLHPDAGPLFLVYLFAYGAKLGAIVGVEVGILVIIILALWRVKLKKWK
jgi:hypothetical protein